MWWVLFFLIGTVVCWQYDRQSGVKNINAHNFDKETNKANRLLYIEFYKSSQFKTKTKKTKKLWSETAKGLKGVATLAAIDCEEETVICENLSIETFPSIQVRQGNGEFQNYDGKLDKKSVMTDAKTRIPSSVQILKKKKVKKFLKKHKQIPKALAFVKSAGSLVIKSLAMQLSDRMVFAEVLKTDRKLVKKYGVEKFPTLIVIPAAKPGEKSKDLGATFYSGRFTGASLLPWLNARALPGDSDDELLELVEQLTDDSCMEALCLQGGLCAALIISQDPSNPDLRLLKEYLPLISQVEDDQIDSLYHFVWLEGIKNMEFLQKAFAIEPRDYPQLVVFNAKKLIYTTFVGSFSFIGVRDFLIGVKGGRIKTQPMNAETLPSLGGDTERCIGMKPPPPMEQPKKVKLERKIKKRGLRGGKGPVDLTEDNWDDALVNSAGNWMVVFIDKEDPDFDPEWKKAAYSLKNMVRFGIVDCSGVENGELANTYEIDSFPAVKVFLAGSTKNEENSEDYDGDLTTDAFKEYALDMLESGDNLVQYIEQANMDHFWQKNPRQPRILLLSEKPNTPNLFKAVALEYRQELVFAHSDDKQLAKGLGVEVFPSVVVLIGQLGEVEDGKAELQINRQVIPKKKLNMKGLTKIGDSLANQWTMLKKQLDEREQDTEETESSHDEL